MSYIRRFLLYFLSVFIFITASSQSYDTLNCKVNGEYFKDMAKGFPELIISPVKWSGKQWIAAGAVVGAGVFLYSKDKEIAEYWQANQSDAMDKADKYFFDPFGKMYYTMPLMGGLYLYGAYTKDSKSKRVAMDFVQATVYSSIIVTVIKHVAHRHRPYQTDPLNPYLWDGPSANSWSHTSFPSGHTITAFTFAAVVGGHYKETIWVPIVAYSLATLEGFSRMYSQKHWSTDVLIGGALGYAIGTFVVNKSLYGIQVSPVIGSNYMGLGFSYKL